VSPLRPWPVAAPPVLTAGHHAWLALGFLCLAVYGSLVPLDYQYVPPGEALQRFRAIAQVPLRIESRADWVTNILLFIPLGYLLVGALGVDRPWFVGLAAALVAIPCCTVLGASIEFAQLYVRSRTTSLRDVAAESIGGLLGTVFWLVWGQRMTAWVRRLRATRDARGLAAWLLPGYLAALVLVHVMPLDLTIRPVEVYHKYRQGQVRLLPFGFVWADPAGVALKALENVAYFVPVGLLMAFSSGQSARERWRWPHAFGFGLATAALVELLQLLVMTRYCDASDVVTGSLAVLAGWGVGRLGRGARPAPAVVPTARRSGGARRAGLGLGRPATCLTLFLGWLGVLILVAWRPFDFDADLALAAHRLRHTSWVPFADYYGGTEANAFDQLLHKTLLFVPVGVVLALAYPPARRSVRLMMTLAAFGLATGLEAGQLFLPSRYASVTDVLIEGWGAWLGFIVTARIRGVWAAGGCPTRSEGS
jgi:glycopeptide antibiotics resistance protein